MGILLFILAFLGILCPLYLVNVIVAEVTNQKNGLVNTEVPENTVAGLKLLLIIVTALVWALFIVLTI